MKLVIVESPTKAKTLSRFLGKEYSIMASMGHVRDLPRKELGVDVKNNFKPTYVESEGKSDSISRLKKAALKAKEVILATDLDREGEAIAYHLTVIGSKSKIKNQKSKFIRIVFHEITREALAHALQNPTTVNMKLVDAQQARRVLDRLVGYQLSPLLWRKVRRGLSAGRVQSPTVRLIVEREREIKAFKAEEYWLINVKLKGKSEKQFLAKLIKKEDKGLEIGDKKKADEIIADLKKAQYQVEKIISKEVKNSPPAPFITSTLQRAASSLFHWSAKKTMREAQRLYERGLITYHRTDSVHLAEQAIAQARSYIEKEFGKEYLTESGRHFKTKSKLAQEAHEAIRPTKMNAKISDEGEKLYQLIFKRFIACQMNPQLLAKKVVDIRAARYLLRAVGQKEVFPGWKKVYQKSKIKNQKYKLNIKEEQTEIPDLSEGERLRLIKVLPEQKFTQPPARYTEGSLIKALEERGIGRPSTYAPIISTIQTRQYVEKIEGCFQPTPVGETVNDFLFKYFKDIVDDDFTAEMEDDLDKIAQGKREWVPVIKEFYSPFAKKLKSVSEKAKRVKIEVEKIGKKCPQCQKGEQVIRVGRFGKFLSCSRFPDCDWKAVYVEKVKGVKCPDCKKGDIVVRKTKKGKIFYGCSNWPRCKWASWRKPKTSP
jgi:DNA topoisomerase-1